MSKKRKIYTAEFKAKLVLELLEGNKTINEIASENEVLPKNLLNWKAIFLENMSLAFDKSAVVKEYKEEVELLQKTNDTLAKKVGTLTIERDWLEGKLESLDLSHKKSMIENEQKVQANMQIPSLNRRLELMSISKTAYYYKSVEKFSSSFGVEIVQKIDEIYTKNPFYGYRRITEQLKRENFTVGKKLVKSAMKFMGIIAIYPKPRTTKALKEHQKYPYLLKKFKNEKNQVIINGANQVWSTDITYIKLASGHAYLSAIIDWGTKKILAWKLSNSMDVSLTTGVLKDALANYEKPEIVNTDQGSQYTAKEHIDILVEHNIAISMDSKGRSIDNIAIERFWRTLKYEDVYLNQYDTMKEARAGIEKFIRYYNNERLHSAIGYNTPDEVYGGSILNNYMLPKVA